MNQPKSRRNRRGAREHTADDQRDGEVRRLWLVADPVPNEIAENAKAAFARPGSSRTVLPLVPDVGGRSDPWDPDGSRGTDTAESGDAYEVVDRLHFGDERSAVHLDIETVVKERSVTLNCTVRARRMKPTDVVAESPGSRQPMRLLGDNRYRASGLPAGPLRVSVDFAGRAGRSVVTTWFTA